MQLKKNLLVIQNADCEHLGTLRSMFENDGFRIDTVIPVSGEKMPTNIEGYNALVVLGGPASLYKNHQYLKDEQKLIKWAISKNIPTLGICLGSQLIAKAAGGTVYRGAKKEIGWYPVELTDSGLNDIFKGLGKKITVFQWHGDTYDLPKDAIVLARSENYPVQAFRIGSGIGIQFHLEVSKEMIFDWMKQYTSELNQVSDYIDVDTITSALDNNVEKIKGHMAVLYRNFSKVANCL